MGRMSAADRTGDEPGLGDLRGRPVPPPAPPTGPNGPAGPPLAPVSTAPWAPLLPPPPPPGQNGVPGATNQQRPGDGAGGAGRSGRRRTWLTLVAGAVSGGLLVGGTVAAALAFDEDGAQVVARPAIVTPEGVMDIQGILDKVQESVVTIETTASAGGGVFEGAGTGIVLSEDGLVLTNAHVIGGSDEIQVRLFDGADHSASLVGSSPDEDLAVIRVDGVDDLVPAELGSSDTLQVGEPVIAIGNALNLGGPPSVTQGIVSAKDRSIQGPGASGEDVDLDNLVQTDAAINPGNSGGPLVDVSGQVVGVNTAIIADSQNIGFAIAIDAVKSQIEDLRNGGGEITPDTAFLGVSTVDVSTVEDAVREQLGIRADEGAFVADVTPDTGADEAGLRAGDVIVAIDGEPVETSEGVADTIREREPDDEITITIEREGKEQTLTATLGRRGG
jgi:S1-C subfamily serine protease